MTTERKPEQLVSILKKILKKTKMPGYELARIIGCPDSTLNRWIKGSFLPSVAWQKLIESNEVLQIMIKEIEKS